MTIVLVQLCNHACASSCFINLYSYSLWTFILHLFFHTFQPLVFVLLCRRIPYFDLQFSTINGNYVSNFQELCSFIFHSSQLLLL